MKLKALIFLAVFSALAAVLFNATSYAAEWKELKSDHFIVYYASGEAFASDVSRKAEQYYTRVADDLGYARYSKFWQWDNRVKIYICDDKGSMVKLAGCQSWCEGMTDYLKATIYTYSASRDFATATLPHEITHLIFRDFVGIENAGIPTWMDEGVAQWEEPKKRELVKMAVKGIRNASELIPLEKFFAMNIMGVSDEKIVNSYYIQAMGLVDFLMQRYGADKFLVLCRELRDGETMDAALSSAYPLDIRSTSDLEKKWLEYVSGL